jgi:5-hydroxyisourate hydrolase-like protein (transthyretin family)
MRLVSPHRWSALVLTLAVAGLAAPAASAGTYTVHACATSDGFTPNQAWARIENGGPAVDTACPFPGSIMGISVPPSDRGFFLQGSESRLSFTAPPGTTIADFRLNHVLAYRNLVPMNTHRFYVLYRLDSTAFAGAGDYDDATRNHLNALGSWYGYPDGAAEFDHRADTVASFPALAGYGGNATSLSIAVGCFPRGTSCGLAPGGTVSPRIRGAEIKVTDDVAPGLSVEAAGLLAGGTRTGLEAVWLRASDNAGIRRVQVLDVTDPRTPQVVAEEDYLAAGTDGGARCSFALARPCPDLGDERISSVRGVTGGVRRLEVRVSDAAGNIKEAGPFTVAVDPPLDRGPLNGRNATEQGRLSVRFARGRRRTRTVRYRSRMRIVGSVRNDAGRAVEDALVRVYRKDEREGAQWTLVKRLRTRKNGRFSWTARASASRALRFDWPSHVNDPQAASSGTLRLRARAAAVLRVRPRHIRRGDVVRFTGSVHGYGIPRHGVPIELVASGGGATLPVRTVRTNREGRFRYRYRRWEGQSSGRITFRARVLTDSSFPYERGSSNPVRRRVN